MQGFSAERGGARAAAGKLIQQVNALLLSRPTCLFDRLSDSYAPSRPSKVRACTCARAFGFGNTSDFDPFLLLDDFRNDIPEDYLAGFPWHPHRGIETITYVLAGTVEHGDSMGNRGRHRRWRRPVDDSGAWDYPPGDAERRPGRPDAWIPVVGEPPRSAENDSRPAIRR